VSARAAIASAGIGADEGAAFLLGNALQTSADAHYLARHIALKAGVPEDRPALTVNRICGSGFEAVIQAAKEILLGESDVCLAGGAESMSQAPHVLRGARWGGMRLGTAGGFFEDMLWESSPTRNAASAWPRTAEELAGRYGLTREEVDRVALDSQRRAWNAWEKGWFGAEIAPVTLKTRKGEAEYAADEHIRPETTMEALAKLRPYFKQDGLVTAGNASGIGTARPPRCWPAPSGRNAGG